MHGAPQCRSKPRSESGGGKPFPCWVLPGCRCRSRAAPPLLRRRTCRLRRLTPATKSFSPRRKSPTSAWLHSMSSTRRTPVRSGPGFSLSGVVAAAAVAAVEAAAVEAVAVAASGAAAVEAVAAAVAVSGAVSASEDAPASASGVPGALLSAARAAEDVGAAAVCRGAPVVIVRRWARPNQANAYSAFKTPFLGLTLPH